MKNITANYNLKSGNQIEDLVDKYLADFEEMNRDYRVLVKILMENSNDLTKLDALHKWNNNLRDINDVFFDLGNLVRDFIKKWGEIPEIFSTSLEEWSIHQMTRDNRPF